MERPKIHTSYEGRDGKFRVYKDGECVHVAETKFDVDMFVAVLKDRLLASEHRDGRLAALERLAVVTKCAEEMLRCFEAGDHFGAESDFDNADNDTWDERCKAACNAMKTALTDSPG